MTYFKVVVACGHMGDAPGLMPVIVCCTSDQYDLGEHYEMAKEHANAQDYDLPFVAIDEFDSPRLMEIFDWKKVAVVRK